MLELILGGARSGKSRLAERLATQCGLAVTYIATSQPLDGEMSARIPTTAQRRPADWGAGGGAARTGPRPARRCRARPLPAGRLPDPVADQPADAG